MLVGVVLQCDGRVRVRGRGREKRVRVKLRILTKNGDISTIAPNGISGPLNGTPKTASHNVSSHQTRDLECFADSSDIPWNPPTIFHPDLTATVPHMSLSVTLRTALSAIPIVYDR